MAKKKDKVLTPEQMSQKIHIGTTKKRPVPDFGRPKKTDDAEPRELNLTLTTDEASEIRISIKVDVKPKSKGKAKGKG